MQFFACNIDPSDTPLGSLLQSKERAVETDWLESRAADTSISEASTNPMPTTKMHARPRKCSTILGFRETPEYFE
eukprot:541131-Prymnesium_polylepis.1